MGNGPSKKRLTELRSVHWSAKITHENESNFYKSHRDFENYDPHTDFNDTIKIFNTTVVDVKSYVFFKESNVNKLNDYVKMYVLCEKIVMSIAIKCKAHSFFAKENLMIKSKFSLKEFNIFKNKLTSDNFNGYINTNFINNDNTFVWIC